MFSRFLKNTAFNFLFLIGLVLILLLVSCGETEQQVIAEKQYIEPPKQKKIPASTTALRVCADPNNLPFSNQKGEGFENKIAEMIGKEMNLPVEYTWWAQRRGFFRNTLRAGICDVVIGVPSSFELVLTTRPYYRSIYVFISRKDHNLDIHSFNDEKLKEIKIGVQMVGDDFTNTPPAHALTNRGIIKNVEGYTMYGDYAQNSPPARIIDAVIKKDVDIAIVWGPLAAYFAGKQSVPLRIEPVSPQIDLPYLPFVYDISMGVRRGEDELKNRLDEIIVRKHDEIEKILDDYKVPRADKQPSPATPSPEEESK
jgi:mxaJ protein